MLRWLCPGASSMEQSCTNLGDIGSQLSMASASLCSLHSTHISATLGSHKAAIECAVAVEPLSRMSFHNSWLYCKVDLSVFNSDFEPPHLSFQSLFLSKKFLPPFVSFMIGTLVYNVTVFEAFHSHVTTLKINHPDFEGTSQPLCYSSGYVNEATLVNYFRI